MRTTAVLTAFLLAIAPGLGGCSLFEQPKNTRGVHIDAEQMHALVPGTTTRADVTSIVGTPTAHATFDDNTWIYVGEVTRPRIGRLPGVLSQDVVELHFDASGVLQSVKHLNGDDGQDVAMVGRTTPSPGSEASFMQQLLGNIGRYSPGGALGGAGSGSSPVGSTGGR